MWKNFIKSLPLTLLVALISVVGVLAATGTMHTINDLMAAAPEQDDDDGAAASDVLPGATFWDLTGGEWGLQTGSMPEGGDVTGEDGSEVSDRWLPTFTQMSDIKSGVDPVWTSNMRAFTGIEQYDWTGNVLSTERAFVVEWGL